MTLPQTIIIHLERHTHRKDRLTRNLDRYGFRLQSWMPAVDNQNLNPLPPWDFDGTEITPWKNWSDPYAKRSLTLGEVACTLSHVKAWQYILQTDKPAIILEDDAITVDQIINDLPKLLDDLDHVDFDLCYLAQRNRPGPQPLMGRHIHAVNYHPLWTLAYILMPSGAEKLLESPWATQIIPADEILPAVFGLNQNQEINDIFQQVSPEYVVASNQNYFRPAEGFEASETEKSRPIIDKQELSAFTVASENKPELQRLLDSSKRYGFEITPLGLGKPWKGGDMTGPGGGQKINLLKQELRKLPGETPVLFTDGYDVIVTGHINAIISAWNEFGNCPVFASEVFCWPDINLLAEYPPSETNYRFLNSGAFIGRAADLLKIVAEDIDDGADDQLYYTKKFLSGDFNMKIDTHCRIFQCLNGALNDLEIDNGRGTLFNVYTETFPAIIHANGPTKDWLENDGKAIGGRWREFYGGMT